MGESTHNLFLRLKIAEVATGDMHKGSETNQTVECLIKRRVTSFLG
jgi:hypothetical protein